MHLTFKHIHLQKEKQRNKKEINKRVYGSGGEALRVFFHFFYHKKRQHWTKSVWFMGLDNEIRIISNKLFLKKLYLLAEMAIYFLSCNFPCTRVVESANWFL